MRVFIIIITALSLQACGKSLYQEGTVTKNRVQVQEEQFYQQMPLAQANRVYLEDIARHYDKYGDGPVSMYVVYDPAKGGALSAAKKGAELAKVMHSHGVYDVQSDVLPVSGENMLIVDYTYYTAQAPKDCGTMPGYADTNIGAHVDYNIGCTVETLISRQVVRPKDLLGQSDTGDTRDGRSASNLVNTVRLGTFNEPLGGQQASGN